LVGGRLHANHLQVGQSLPCWFGHGEVRNPIHGITNGVLDVFVTEILLDGSRTHLAKDIFHGLEGDVRVTDDTIIVTYYNAPESLRSHYEGLPQRLIDENIEPTIPWLYNYQLDFRFR
jgi:hypothetical protein